MAENMPPDDNPQKALKMALEHLSSLAKGDDTKLKESVYSSFSAISYLLIEAKKANFQPGWALKVKGPNGLILFTPEEAATIEGLAKHAEVLFQDNAKAQLKDRVLKNRLEESFHSRQSQARLEFFKKPQNPLQACHLIQV